MAEQFVDLSHHNAGVDLAAYAKAGHRRVVLKATEGTAFTDPAFPARWVRAGRAGLARGAYHYARTTTPGAAQADRLLAVVGAAGPAAPEDFWVLDLEDNSSAAATGRADQFAGEFCARMVARGHRTGLLYTGRWYADPAGVTPADVPAGWRRLWLADYGSAADSAMALPAGWNRAHVAARQYTDAAIVPGVGGPADYSRVLTDWLGQKLGQKEDDMTTTAEVEALLRRYLLGPETAPDSAGNADPHNLADVLVRFGELVAAGGQNKIFRGWRTGKSTTWPVAAQLAVLSGQIQALTAAVAKLAAAGGSAVDTDALTAELRQAAHDGAAAALREVVQAAEDAEAAGTTGTTGATEATGAPSGTDAATAPGTAAGGVAG